MVSREISVYIQTFCKPPEDTQTHTGTHTHRQRERERERERKRERNVAYKDEHNNNF